MKRKSMDRREPPSSCGKEEMPRIQVARPSRPRTQVPRGGMGITMIDDAF